MTVQHVEPATFEQEWADWRQRREAALADAHGFLAITSINWLSEELQGFADAPGFVEFEAGGQPQRLTAFDGQAPGSLTLLFSDATSGVTTYAANRSLAVAAPAEDGTVALDFNRAVNLPCAFTDLATCPLPPAENHLQVAVEAGEKIPYERA